MALSPVHEMKSTRNSNRKKTKTYNCLSISFFGRNKYLIIVGVQCVLWCRRTGTTSYKIRKKNPILWFVVNQWEITRHANPIFRLGSSHDIYTPFCQCCCVRCFVKTFGASNARAYNVWHILSPSGFIYYRDITFSIILLSLPSTHHVNGTAGTHQHYIQLQKLTVLPQHFIWFRYNALRPRTM